MTTASLASGYHEMGYSQAKGEVRTTKSDGTSLAAVATLIEGARTLDPWGDTKVNGVANDQRDVRPGDLFAAVVGQHFDSRTVVGDALARGAHGVLVESEPVEYSIPQVVVPAGTLRKVLPLVSQYLYGDPSRDLGVIGVTGTNGKTTTVHLITEILKGLGQGVGTMGTVWTRLTTPEAPEIARTLRTWVNEGKSYAAMEVSSIGIAMHRSDALHYRVAAFTNLTRDHLDFHGTMENYFLTKARLFTDYQPLEAVINVDDPWGARLREIAQCPVITLSHRDLEGLALLASGLSFEYRGVRFESSLVGEYNAMNLATAVVSVAALGYPLAAIAEVTPGVSVPRGRLELVSCSRGKVFVDYAHSPDALSNVLGSLRATLSPPGRLIAVFGASGDRDRGKRPTMGKVAEELADLVVVTSDNTRSEDPQVIAEAILSGMERPERAKVYVDRFQAIEYALSEMGPQDVCVVAGKGHEQVQKIATGNIPFDDAEVIRRLRGELS